MNVKGVSHLAATERWSTLSKTCERDLSAKKIALALVIILNLGAICAGLWAIIEYTTLPTDAFIASPYIAGALWALVDLQLPTFGVNSMNIRQYSNPAMIVSKAIGFLFFGPTKLMMHACDWRDYSNPVTAKAIVYDLKHDGLIDISEKYGDRLLSLVKYGILSRDDYANLSIMNKNYRSAKLIKDYCIQSADQDVEKRSRKETSLVPKGTQKKLELERTKWRKLQRNISLPDVTIPEVDPSATFAKCKMLWHRLWT